MSRSLVQYVPPSSIPSGSVTFTATAGDLLDAEIHWNTGANLSSVTDSDGNTWFVIAGSKVTNADITETIQQAWCIAKNSGSLTVTANMSSGSARSIAVFELRDSSGTLEFGSAVSNSGTSSSPSSGSLTTETNNETGIVMINTANSQPDDALRGPLGGFAVPSGGAYTPYWYAAEAYLLDLGAAGSVTATWNMQGISVPWSMNLVTFRIAAPPVTLTGSSCNQGNAGGTGAVTVDTAFHGANCMQGNAGSAGAITQVQTLTVANCVQANLGGTGSTDPYSRLKGLLRSTPLNQWVQANLNSFYDAAVLSGDRAVDPGNQASVVYAWSSFGWDEKKARLLLWGGGHANYTGDELYVWNGDTGLWDRACLPTKIDAADPDLLLPSKDAPQSSHTYANNQYLYNQDVFVTFGGAAANSGDAFTELVTADPRVTRHVGPFAFDMHVADPNKVGGGNGTGYNVARLGSGGWHNRRDLVDGYPIDTLDHKQGASAYVNEGGTDVCYFTMGGASGFPNWYKYTFGDIRGGTARDTCTKIGVTSNSVIFDGFMVHDSKRGMLYRQGATLSGKTSEIAVMPVTATGSTADTPIQVIDELGNPFPMVLTPTVYATRYGAVYDDANDRIWLWDSNGTNPGTVFYIPLPAYDPGTGWASTTWTAYQIDPAGLTPRGGHINGVLGKMKFVPTLGAFVVLDSTEATHVNEPGVWFFKTSEAPANLVGDSSIQGNTSSPGAISQASLVLGENCSQSNVASAGAISISSGITLTPANAAQANEGTGRAISISGSLIAAPSVQDNVAAASAIVQAHILAAASSSQSNAGSSASIGVGDPIILEVSMSSQANDCSTGEISTSITFASDSRFISAARPRGYIAGIVH